MSELEGLRRLLEWENGAPNGRRRFDLHRTKAQVWYVTCFVHKEIEVGHEGGIDLDKVVNEALYLTSTAVDESLWDRVNNLLQADKSRKFLCGREGERSWSFQFYGDRYYAGPSPTERGSDPRKALTAVLEQMESYERSVSTMTESDPVVLDVLGAASAESDLTTARRLVVIKPVFKTACDKTKAAVLDRLLEVHARLGSQTDDPDGNKTARCVLKFLRGPAKDHSSEINKLRDGLIFQFQLWIES
jgi:hypothetical protein